MFFHIQLCGDRYHINPQNSCYPQVLFNRRIIKYWRNSTESSDLKNPVTTAQRKFPGLMERGWNTWGMSLLLVKVLKVHTLNKGADNGFFLSCLLQGRKGLCRHKLSQEDKWVKHWLCPLGTQIIFSFSPWVQHSVMSSPSKGKMKWPKVKWPKLMVAPGFSGEIGLCSYRSISKNVRLSHSLYFSHALSFHSVPSVISFPVLRRWASSQEEIFWEVKRQMSLLTHTWPESRGFPGLSANLPLVLLSGLALAAARLLFFINQAESCNRPWLPTCPHPSAECSNYNWEHKSWPSDATDWWLFRGWNNVRTEMYQEKKY